MFPFVSCWWLVFGRSFWRNRQKFRRDSVECNSKWDFSSSPVCCAYLHVHCVNDLARCRVCKLLQFDVVLHISVLNQFFRSISFFISFVVCVCLRVLASDKRIQEFKRIGLFKAEKRKFALRWSYSSSCHTQIEYLFFIGISCFRYFGLFCTFFVQKRKLFVNSWVLS